MHVQCTSIYIQWLTKIPKKFPVTELFILQKKEVRYWNITTHSFSVKKNPPSSLTITKKHTLDIQKMWFKYFQKSALIIIYIATLKDFVIAIKILIHFLCKLKKLKFKKRKHLKQFWNQCSYSNYNSMTSYPGMG